MKLFICQIQPMQIAYKYALGYPNLTVAKLNEILW